MKLGMQNLKGLISRRYNSTVSRNIQPSANRCLNQLKSYDYSSYILSAYIPEPVRNHFIAIKALNVELSKIYPNNSNDQVKSKLGFTSNEMKLKIWKDSIVKVFQDRPVNEPITLLLKDCVNQEFNLTIEPFEIIFNSKQVFLDQGSFKSIDDICSYGEGYYSQFNYLIQNLLLSNDLSPSTILLTQSNQEIQKLIVEILAHLGQSQSLLSTILTIKFYAQNSNKVYLPNDLLINQDLSQESILRYFQNHKDVDHNFDKKLQNIIYEMSVTANDHFLSSKYKLDQLKLEIAKSLSSTDVDQLILRKSKFWKNGIPDCLFLPFMVSIPINDYLIQLEKYDFNILNKKLKNYNWKLIWNSYRFYQKRSI
ncbi:hypothetical protein WICMUC_005672 [Wickerhamomyces mucosus]|uniref:Uncharacterized protein n=1 Tax=Wickerhamomyces mucosus TaxID=1378264 RepID=A0A9P8P828_9ASCO|nr:hypothetical protein WICMUC_005672 [Wickerhamomyces mucosus]